jgi:hypothetical protein
LQKPPKDGHFHRVNSNAIAPKRADMLAARHQHGAEDIGAARQLKWARSVTGAASVRQ